jgi:hypothetical protein
MTQAVTDDGWHQATSGIERREAGGVRRQVGVRVKEDIPVVTDVGQHKR